MQAVAIKCQCGEVKGQISSMQPKKTRHMICCCDDCQAFAHFLKRDDILDEFGGTRIVQMVPAQVQFSQGKEYIRCMKLKPKGIYRWYTDCCHTPIANTLSAGVPFVGVIHNIFDNESDIEDRLGPAAMRVQVKHAIKAPGSQSQVSKGFPVGLMVSTVVRLMIAKIQKEDKPSPFFTEQGEPVASPVILSNTESRVL